MRDPGKDVVMSRLKGLEIDINFKWFRGISKPRSYDHSWQQNNTILSLNDVFIKLLFVAK